MNTNQPNANMIRKRFSSSLLLSVLMTAVVLSTSCKSDADFSNIDKHADISMGLAMPIGSMSASINDFIGSENIRKYLAVNEAGVLQFNYEMTTSQPFATIDLSHFNADAHIPQDLINLTGGMLIGDGEPHSITIPFVMDMAELNTAASIPERGRIDSMHIRNAAITATISLQNWDLPKDYIYQLNLRLGDQFRLKGSNKISLPFQDYGQTMTIDLSDFTIDLIKNHQINPTTKDEADANAGNQIEMEFEIVLLMPAGATQVVSPDSRILIDMQNKIMSYEALWGYFVPGNKMQVIGDANIGSDLNEWAKMRKCTLMLAQPRVNITAATEFTAPLVLRINNLSVTSMESGATEKAHFAEGDHMTWHYYTLDSYSRQFKTPIGTQYKDSLMLTEDETLGDLDRLFKLRPDSLNYNLNVDIDYDYRHLQHRMTPNPDVAIDLKLYVPLTFGKGMELNYTDTIKDVNIALNLDSLIESVKMIDSIKTSDLKLRVRAENTIPLDIKAGFAFLDSLDNPIDLSGLIDNDTLLIAAPKDLERGVVNPDKPGVSEIIINVSKEEFQKLHKINKIVYDAYLMTNDESFNSVGTQYVSLIPESGFTMHMAASANLEALLNLDFKSNK